MLKAALNSRGYCLVAEANGKPAGYALATPVPGLDSVYDLQGCIDPARQRLGYGGRLLEHLIEELGQRGGGQLSRAVTSPDDPAARFLQNRGFFVEHVEARLQRDRLEGLEASPIPAGFTLQSFPKPEAIGHFIRLYDLAFSDHSWYQPYGDAVEVAADLADPADLLFLGYGREPVGFLWIRRPAVDVAEFEPIGIAPLYQGRGLARPFLLAGIAEAAGQGAETVTLGAWEDNTAALRLYRSVGFRRTNTITYLAIDLRRK